MSNHPSTQNFKKYMKTYSPYISNPHEQVSHTDLIEQYPEFVRPPEMLLRMAINTSGNNGYEYFNNYQSNPQTNTQRIPILTYMAANTSGRNHLMQNENVDVPGYNSRMGGAELNSCFKSLIMEQLSNYVFSKK